MKIEYLIQIKEERSAENLSPKISIQNALKLCFLDVKTDTFIINDTHKDIPIHFVLDEHNVKLEDSILPVIYLKFESNLKGKEQNAKLLDQADSSFMHRVNCGEIRFLIIKLYDERSIHYCIKAYPLFCKFESKLRCLILKLLTKTFGCMWPQETLSQELRNGLREKVRSDKNEIIASEAIYEMDYSELIKFLFSPFRAITTDSKIERLLNDGQLELKNTAEIRTILEEIRLTSNWDRFFKEIEIDDLQDTLKNISKQRNKIAHSKEYKLSDFQSDKVTISTFISQIDRAIKLIELKPISTQDAIATVGSLATFNMPDVSRIASNFGIILQGVANATAGIKDAYKNLAPALTILCEYLVRVKEDESENSSSAENTTVEPQIAPDYESTGNTTLDKDTSKAEVKEGHIEEFSVKKVDHKN